MTDDELKAIEVHQGNWGYVAQDIANAHPSERQAVYNMVINHVPALLAEVRRLKGILNDLAGAEDHDRYGLPPEPGPKE